jgi:hypothetical protein
MELAAGAAKLTSIRNRLFAVSGRRRTVPSARTVKGLEITSRILSSAFFLLRGILRWR